MKRNKLIYAIMFVCTLFATSCSNEEDINVPATEGNIRFCFNDSGVRNTVNTKATTDKEYRTTFENGDRIGIYAFESQEVTTPIANYSNICLTYKNGEWVTDEEIPLPYDEELENAIFYAYYPYQTETTISGTAGAPLADLIAGWSIDSSKSYTENDLMTGSGTAEKDKNDILVSITLNHEMAMIVVGLSGGTTYQFTNTDVALSDYTASGGNATFSIGETDVTSMAEIVDGKYRLLVKPQSSSTLSIVYGGKTYKQEGINIPASQYQEYSVGSSSSSDPVKFNLSVGDYYCSDGTLIESDKILTDDDKTKIIGVVYYVGNPQPGPTGLNYNSDYIDILAAEHPDCTHGLVYAVKSANSEPVSSWGGSSFAGGKASEYYTTYNYAAGTAKKYIWETSKSNYAWRMLGYDCTAVLKANSSDFPILFEYLDEVDAPSASSGWYLPSYAELKLLATGQLSKEEDNVEINTEDITKSLDNINGEDLFEKTDVPYASSTFSYEKSKDEFSNKIQIYQNKNGEISGTTLSVSENNFPHHLRFSLAF